MKNINTIGIDLAKNIMHLVEVNSDGKQISKHKSKRCDLITTIRDRVQKTNSMISTLHEYGFIAKATKSAFPKSCKAFVEIAYLEKYITKQAYDILLIDCTEIETLLAKEKILDKLIVQNNRENSKAIKLQKIIGIGPINASCLSIAPIENYADPRDFAASLGLVPKQFSSGDKTILGSITKQGDRYVRTMLIQAGRSIAIRAKMVKESSDTLIKWAQKKFAEGKSFNVICVALANKLARIAYSMIMNQTEYRNKSVCKAV